MPGCKHRRHNCGDGICVEAVNHGSRAGGFVKVPTKGQSYVSWKISNWRKKAWSKRIETEETYREWLKGELLGQI